MTCSKGVLTIAHGHPRFARQAVNLARSIRLRDPEMPLAVVTDLPAALFEGMFDSIIEWNFYTLSLQTLFRSIDEERRVDRKSVV